MVERTGRKFPVKTFIFSALVLIVGVAIAVVSNSPIALIPILAGGGGALGAVFRRYARPGDSADFYG